MMLAPIGEAATTLSALVIGASDRSVVAAGRIWAPNTAATTRIEVRLARAT
jgi:hypothetical protein